MYINVKESWFVFCGNHKVCRTTNFTTIVGDGQLLRTAKSITRHIPKSKPLNFCPHVESFVETQCLGTKMTICPFLLLGLSWTWARATLWTGLGYP